MEPRWSHVSFRVTLCNVFSHLSIGRPPSLLFGDGKVVHQAATPSRCLPPPGPPRRMIVIGGRITTLFTARVGRRRRRALIWVSLRRPPDRPWPCDTSVTALIGGRPGPAHTLLSRGIHRSIPQAATTGVARAFRRRRTCLGGCPLGILCTVLTGATPHSTSAVAAAADVLTRPPSGPHPDPSRGSSVALTLRVRLHRRRSLRPPHAPATLSSLRISRGRQELLTGRLRITFTNAFGVTFRSSSPTPPRTPPDHPRACISRVRRVAQQRLRSCPRSIFASIGRLGTRSRRRRAR